MLTKTTILAAFLVAAFTATASAHLHPGQGRFVQRDPQSYINGANDVLYLGADPVIRRDPSGLAFTSIPPWNSDLPCNAPNGTSISYTLVPDDIGMTTPWLRRKICFGAVCLFCDGTQWWTEAGIRDRLEDVSCLFWDGTVLAGTCESGKIVVTKFDDSGAGNIADCRVVYMGITPCRRGRCPQPV